MSNRNLTHFHTFSVRLSHYLNKWKTEKGKNTPLSDTTVKGLTYIPSTITLHRLGGCTSI